MRTADADHRLVRRIFWAIAAVVTAVAVVLATATGNAWWLLGAASLVVPMFPVTTPTTR